MRLLYGDSFRILDEVPSEQVHCCITSPPYWGLRYYDIPGTEWPAVTYAPMPGMMPCVHVEPWTGCLGLEPNPEMYVGHVVAFFRKVRRWLRNDATLWVNLGDSYATGAGKERPGGRHELGGMVQPNRLPIRGLKRKDMVGIPWRVAFALQADGWWLRQDLIWYKPTAMPESVKDRCTKAHEYVFLLSKARRPYFDWKAIQEKASEDTHARYARGRSDKHKYAAGDQPLMRGFDHMPGVTPKALKAVSGWDAGKGTHLTLFHNVPKAGRPKFDAWGRVASNSGERRRPPDRNRNNPSFGAAVKDVVLMRNKRSVWEIPAEPCHDLHFAAFPQKLVHPMVLAGCPPGGTVLDPFAGKFTTGVVAKKLGRHFIGMELNRSYVAMGERNISAVDPLFSGVVTAAERAS